MGVTTESRIFVAQLTRDLAAREVAGAKLLSPGTKQWQDAFRGFGLALSKSGSLIKAAKMFQAGIECAARAEKRRLLHKRFHAPLTFGIF